MKQLFVPYAIASTLKEKGFNEPCLKFYLAEELRDSHPEYIATQKDVYEVYNGILAPIYQQVVDWFMNEHLIFITVNCETWLHTFYASILTADGIRYTKKYNDHYEAMNNAIEEALKLI